MEKEYLLRPIKFNPKTKRRIGKYTKIMAVSPEEASKKFWEKRGIKNPRVSRAPRLMFGDI